MIKNNTKNLQHLVILSITSLALVAGLEWYNSFESRNIWNNVSSSFSLTQQPTQGQMAIEKEIQWFVKQQDYFTELTRNAKPYIYYINKKVQAKHMPSELDLLPMIESNYNPLVQSKAGAVGLWQLIPKEFPDSQVKIAANNSASNVKNSTKVALIYLNYLHGRFNDWLLAFAAYNAGEGRIEAAIKYNKAHGLPTDFWSLKLPKETQQYVPKILALATIIKNPNQYHIKLVPVVNAPVAL